MSEFNITVESGSSVRLLTSGKYCEEDIVIKATGGGGTTPANPIIESLSVTENGTYAAPSGVDGYSPVQVNVPIPDGYIIPNGIINIDKNGTYDVTEKASAIVSIPEREVVLQNKTIETNGTYTADSGYDGLGQVTVNVPSSGGGGEDLNAVLTEQEALIAELQDILSNKMFSGNSELPDGYSQIDFIEFNGEQLIDTKIIGNQNTRIRSRFTWGNSTQSHLFGCLSSDNTASITSYMNGSWRFGAKSETKNVAKNNTLLPYEAYVDKTMIGITGSNTSISDVDDFETIGTLLLGGARSSSGGLPGSGLVGRVFYFKLWDGETLILDLIPVTNGTLYRFWDKVSKIFFDPIDDSPLTGGNL